MRKYYVKTCHDAVVLKDTINEAALNGYDFKIESVTSAASTVYKTIYTLVYSYGVYERGDQFGPS